MAEVGLGVQGDKSADEYIAIARAAEAAGLDVISVYSDLMYQPQAWLGKSAGHRRGVAGECRVVMGAVTVVDHDGDAARDRARTEGPNTSRSSRNSTQPFSFLLL